MAGLGISVGGAADFARVARALHEAGDKGKGLSKELDRGVRKAADEVPRAIRRDVDDYMPKGYEDVFKASLQFKVEVKQVFEHRVTVVVFALGAKGNRRQVEQLEKGEFRAPNWGRWRARRGINRSRHKFRNKWHAQRVKPGFATIPAKGAERDIRKVIDAHVRRVAEKIERAT